MIKAAFIRKIKCTTHEDRTPSLALYSDGSGFCFSCNAYFKDIGEKQDVKPVPKEDIQAKIQYIKSLPTIEHRGLTFPFDNTGYYILWPKSDYYKCRTWVQQDKGGKYLNPAGITQPWYIVDSQSATTLLVIEGEINTMSVQALNLNVSLMCPGSAGQFNLKKSGIPLQAFKQYDSIKLIADKDPAGIKALVSLKLELINYVPDVQIKALDEDYNTILTLYGKETLNKEIKSLGV